MGERILGVVGGVGPESTLDYYRRLLDGYHARVGDVYIGELVQGVFRSETRTRLLEILAALAKSEAVDGVILGGTELSLILPEPEYLGIPVLNAAAIHVAEAIDWLTATDEGGTA